MAKGNRSGNEKGERSDPTLPPDEQSPGGRVGEDAEDGEPGRKDTNGLERAIFHLQAFEDELRGLVAHKAKLAGRIRRKAGELRIVTDGDVKKWGPIVVLRRLLLEVQSQVSPVSPSTS